MGAIVDDFVYQVANYVFQGIKWSFETGRDVSIQLGTWLYNAWTWLWINFKYTNPWHLFVLASILLLDVLGFIVLFGGATAYNAGGFTSADIGSSYIMAGLGRSDLGITFEGNGTVQANGTGSGSGTNVSGGYANTTIYDNLCGNGYCDSFNTSTRIVSISTSLFLDCRTSTLSNQSNLIYNIPDYCRGNGTYKTYVISSFYGESVYPNAVCNYDNFYANVDSHCFIQNGSVWYTETPANCIEDCRANACERDMTCVNSEFNCDQYDMSCCPVGSAGAYKCVNNLADCANGYDTGSLAQLQRSPYHCPCTSNAGCVGEQERDTCCPAGTYHAGFCYYEYGCEL